MMSEQYGLMSRPSYKNVTVSLIVNIICFILKINPN
jgi:hypothetical protein